MNAVKSKPLQSVLKTMHIRLRLSMPDLLSAISSETEVVLGQHIAHVCDEAECQLAKSLARYLKGSTIFWNVKLPMAVTGIKTSFQLPVFTAEQCL